MTRFRFRGHRGAQDAVNRLKQQAQKDAKEASEKSHAEVEERKKKDVKEETDRDRYKNKSYKHSRDKLRAKKDKDDRLPKGMSDKDAVNLEREKKGEKPVTHKFHEEKFDLPEKYEGDHSVRKIYDASQS